MLVDLLGVEEVRTRFLTCRISVDDKIGGANVPPRAASPLPPNVPTGPRNQNKYKDRDNNAPAVDGLDYGGGERGSRTPTDVHEDRSSR